MAIEPAPRAIGVILAGGLGRRIGGGDKPLRKIRGITILEHVVRRLSDQCDGIILNANGDPGRFSSFGLTNARFGANTISSGVTVSLVQ